MRHNFKLWMLLVPVALSLASCSKDNDDELMPIPITTPPAVDNGKWKVTEENMDKSYRPGDDFYMYINGGFWKRTTVSDATPFVKPIMDEVQAWVDRSLAALTLPSREKLLADAAKNDAATIEAQKQKLQGALARVEALTTKEEAWQLAAKLIAEGYNTPVEPLIFSYMGKIGVVIYPKISKDYIAGKFMDEKSIEWRLAHDPDVLASVRKLKTATTQRTARSFSNEEWPMLVTIFTTLGISLDDVYLLDVYPPLKEKGLTDIGMQILQGIQNQSVEEWKNSLSNALKEDAVFCDNTALSATGLSLTDAVKNFSNKYLMYEESRAFADAYVTNEMKQRTTVYCEQLRQSFRERIQKSVWMSDASKQKATEKLNAMAFNIGAPDKWMEEGLADLSQEATLLDDVLALRRTLMNLRCKLVGMNSQSASFHQIILQMPLTVVNASYSPNNNTMNIWPAWMVAPCYDPELNEAHNYATMVVFGHEMTHGFDTNGARYNKVGDPEDIWGSEEDRQQFAARAKELADCYSQFEVMPLTGVYNDGPYTVSENIADLGGFLIVYDTYMKHLKEKGFKGELLRLQQQRFYEAVAYFWNGKWTAAEAQKRTNGIGPEAVDKDIHSMFHERVNGIVTNTDDWYDLFDVKEGEKLYRATEDRIRIW